MKKNSLSWVKIILIILLSFFGLLVFYIAFGLVPTMVELAVKYNWCGLGRENKWFYFMYLITIWFALFDVAILAVISSFIEGKSMEKFLKSM